jgi:2-polyprenyl-3-methyl-5-hydroxy-6-metoxy-1,4-benzoquinol methylase
LSFQKAVLPFQKAVLAVLSFNLNSPTKLNAIEPFPEDAVMQITFDQEVKQGKRFQFGKNWSHFLETLNPERVAKAEASIQKLLGVTDLKGKRFLDIGSGSGLFSLAARRLGAQVYSFDYDPESVGCTRELKRRYYSKSNDGPDDRDWIIEKGSALDSDYIKNLGTFDVVYSWGVLHHTGSMWEALENAALAVKKDGGILAIALYNDQENRSKRWLRVKQMYCSSKLGKLMVCSYFIPKFFMVGLLRDIKNGMNPMRRYTASADRGMSVFRDWFDWLGGLPFEVARPEQVFHFYQKLGFELKDMKTVGGSMGCNEFVLIRK